MPTPKKAGRAELIKSLLPASDVPDSYVDVFDNVNTGGKVDSAGVSRVLADGKLGADEQSRIMSIVAPGGQIVDLGRNEFNVLLALIGLAQEGEELSLDSVDERRRGMWDEK